MSSTLAQSVQCTVVSVILWLDSSHHNILILGQIPHFFHNFQTNNLFLHVQWAYFLDTVLVMISSVAMFFSEGYDKALGYSQSRETDEEQ
jgi:hypothetical protein